MEIRRGDVIEPELPELVLPGFDVGEIQPIPESRIMEDLMGSGEFDSNLSLNGDLWADIGILCACFAGERGGARE